MSRLHTMTDIIQKIVAMDKVKNHRRRQNKRWLIALGAWLCRFIQVWENSTNNNNNTEAIIILSKSAAICSPSTNAWGEFVSAQCVCVWSHQWQQAWVEEDVALCDVHAADQLT